MSSMDEWMAMGICLLDHMDVAMSISFLSAIDP